MERSMESWLAFAGFSANPFAVHEAEKETRLPDYFVAPDWFADILGKPAAPSSAVVFADRGCGKTAQRIMVRHRCRPNGFKEGQALCVAYSDFDAAAALAPSLSPREIRNVHVAEILHLAVHELAEALLNTDATLGRYLGLPRWERRRIHWFLHHFKRGLTLSQRSRLIQAEIEPLARDDALGMDDLSGDVLEELRTDARSNPAALLCWFGNLINGLGCEALYVLVDGVDELAAMADAESAVQLMAPLLTDWRLLNTPGLAFKFFLPQEWADHFQAQTAIRQDRLQMHQVEWTPEDLLTMLHRRLATYRGAPGLSDLCEPELAGRIEADLVHLARGSPRDMIRLGCRLLSEHCVRSNGALRRQISPAAWEDAKLMFLDDRNRVCTIKNNDPFFPSC